MANIFIYPTTSFILFDLVNRFGHKPLTVTTQIRDLVTNLSVDSPPLNITQEDPKKGLKYAAIEVPAGIRGRMSLIGPLIEISDAAIIVQNAPANFGCSGCNRTNELSKFLIRSKLEKKYILEIKYPETEEQAEFFVNSIFNFLNEIKNEMNK